MTLFQIVAFYIALHCIMAPVLMYRVGQIRIREKISLGDNGNPALLARIRAHGNFAENTPLALLGLAALAWLGAAPWVLHLFGAAFFIGRILHVIGMEGPHSAGKSRTYGIVLTLLTYVGQALSILYLIVTNLG